MNNIILLASTQYPGYGGAATNTYALIKFLRSVGYRAYGIFFENSNVNVDPANIGNIVRFDCSSFDRNDTDKIASYRKILDNIIMAEPTLMLCKNYMAPTYCRTLYPTVKNIYLVSGISHFSIFFPKMAAQNLLMSDIDIPIFNPEVRAINNSDLVVTNSKISLSLINRIYPKFIKKIYPHPIDTTKEIQSLMETSQISKFEKNYDFIVTASLLTRNDKNNLFLVNVLKDPRFDKYTKIIIGDNNSEFKSIPNSTVINILPHNELLNYMKKSKILLYPSLSDANPNTVREAIYQKCMALISNNIGYYEKFPNFSVCTSYDKNEWVKKSMFLIENYDKLIKTYNIDFGVNEDIVSLIEKFV